MSIRSGLACIVLLACAGRPTLDDPHVGQLSITVHNEVGSPLCEVHIFPAHHPEIGHNWLQAQREIATGTSRTFWVPNRDPAETYQIQANGCPQRAFAGYAPTVFMNGPANVILFDEGNPRSKDAAQGIAHTNENTTLIPAKFSRGSTSSHLPRAR